MRNLTGIVFEDGLCGFAGRSVKKNNCCHVFSKWFSNAGNLLRQEPHTDAVMAGAEAKIDQLAHGPFTFFEAAQSSRTKSVFVFSKK